MRGRQLLWIIGLGAAGCLGPAPADELAAAGAAAPIETQVTWKALGQPCAAGFVQLGVDPAAETDARPAACIHQSFCEARPWFGDYCAATPKSVLTTDAATFWSDFLVTCPAVGRLVPGTAPGTAEIRVPDAAVPGGKRVFSLDAQDLHTRVAATGGYEPCLTNPDGAGLRDPSCDGGAGTVCSLEGDALALCVSTWALDRRGAQSVQVQRVEVLARDVCASGICEDPRAAAVACQEDRALLPPTEILGDDGQPALACGPGRSLVDVAGGKMCLAPSYCAAQAAGLYCDGAPSGVRDTRVWGAESASDSVAPGALVVAGSVAVQCGRDGAGRATTTLFPCASGTCVGNGAGFGCVDTSCELSAAETDLEALYWSGSADAIAAVEGAYCSEIHDATLLSCQLVQAYDARLDAFVIRLLPESFRRCAGATPVCAQNDPGVADACVPADASAAAD
jgi:hypothetical protein